MGEVGPELGAEGTLSKPHVLAIGMLPPPVGGQAVMFEAAINELKRHADVDVIDIQAQRNIGQTGKLSFGKLSWFLKVIVREIVPRLRRRYDILYYCPAGPNRIAVFKDLVLLSLVRRRARKTVYHFHATGTGALIASQSAVVRRLADKLLFEPDLAIRCADVTPNDPQLYRARAARVIANGIADPAPAYRGRSKSNDGPLQLVCIGAMVEKKGIYDLIDVATILQSRGVDFVMHFVGEGVPEEIDRFDRMIAARGLSPRMRRHGVLLGAAKYDLLFESDALVFPSFWASETQPLVVIEAHAMQLPAVAYQLGGIRTIIDDGASGYVVPLRDTQAFADAIAQLGDRAKARAMGIQGRHRFEQYFQLTRFAADIGDAVLNRRVET
jgi:glycosyltransferase involved in cell wall biosynthesis